MRGRGETPQAFTPRRGSPPTPRKASTVAETNPKRQIS
ncbi:hypothetical protein J2S19_001829 [Metabacillus malikii]|uniref:Uncharacterized protein n=1 Tax=Metabacillus malikii TaxID=1504265 RepID=A0ABT9ZE98_9BACI|nr:hypothetical protein [Metabacillus malikii]